MRRGLGIGLTVAILLTLAATVPVFAQCDGNAPGWVENNGGCASWSPIEYLYPWHWGVPDQCLGLCRDSLGA
jgi:hypothetical protein